MVTITRPETNSVSVPTLPGRYYYDPAIFAQEQERIFAASWMLAGHASRIPSAGDYFLTELAGDSVIVLRDRDNTLRAFLNVCRHRGARLCTARQGRLNATIQCHYHAWTYALNGNLIGAPNMKEDDAFDYAAFGLLPVHLQEWEGFIFLNLSDAPEPLVTPDGLGHPRVARYGIGQLKIGGTKTYDLKSNWKIVIANYEECAHCALVHPELSAQVPLFKAGYVDDGIDEGAELAEGVTTLTFSGTSNRPPLSGLSEYERHRYFGTVLRPCMFLDLHPDYVIVSMIQPLAADRTLIVSDWLFDPDVMARPDFDPSDAVEFNDLVSRQDGDVCELSQLGVTSRGFRKGGIYGPTEAHIRGFDDYVLAKLGHDSQQA